MSDPDETIRHWGGMLNNSFSDTIRSTFSLPEDDATVYEAEGFSMTLSEIQNQVDTGKYKYHYRSHGASLTIPPTDIAAYTTLFSPAASPSKALKSFAANAKKSSPRESVSHYLVSQRLVPDSISSKIPKSKTHLNPYYDIWTWSCHETGFVGPLGDDGYADREAAKMTHPILPVLYHHFGCLCPSWEGLALIREMILAKGKGSCEGVVEVGSGNGYWAYLLRRLGVSVTAIDNADAGWRTMWISNTIKESGPDYLKKNGGGRNHVLLMVYPIVAGTFTKDVLRAYKGDTVVIAGTQNANRFTTFKDMKAEEYFEKEKKDFELTVRIALPSFAGKDEALYVFKRNKL